MKDIKDIAKHLSNLYKKGGYDPMREETLPFTYRDLEAYCRADELDIEYIDPTERRSLGGHPSYEQDIEEEE